MKKQSGSPHNLEDLEEECNTQTVVVAISLYGERGSAFRLKRSGQGSNYSGGDPDDI